LATTGAAGAFIGSFFTNYVPVSILLMIIGLIVSYESFALLNGSRMKKERGNKPDETASSDRILVHTRNRLILLESLIGFGVGFLGGVVGLVLGSIRMPAMIFILKMEPRIAIGNENKFGSRIGNGNIWFDRTYHKYQH
jgi:uncharacterized protein